MVYLVSTCGMKPSGSSLLTLAGTAGLASPKDAVTVLAALRASVGVVGQEIR